MADNRPTLFVAQVLFNYEPQSTEEIALGEGQFCLVLETNEAGWWLVRDGSAQSRPQSGWAPSNFMRRLELDEVNLLMESSNITPVAITQTSAPRGFSSKDQTNDLRSRSLMTPPAASKVVPVSPKRQCARCRNAITETFAVAGDQVFHLQCFQCETCKVNLGGGVYFMKDGMPYCDNHYHELFGNRCAACSQSIRGRFLNAMDKTWHPEHFLCADCQQPFDNDEYYVGPDQAPYCAKHYNQRFAVKCTACNLPIDGTALEALNQSYHTDCFRCSVDMELISASNPFHIKDGVIYCAEHFESLLLERCAACEKPVIGQFVQVLSKTYHLECFTCSQCQENIANGQFHLTKTGGFICAPCDTPGKFMKEIGQSQAKGSQMMTKTAKMPQGLDQVRTAPVTVQPMSCIQNNGNGPIRMKASELMGKDRLLPETIDRSHKEHYLFDDEFQALFGMTRDEFASIKPWKQQQIKQRIGLF